MFEIIAPELVPFVIDKFKVTPGNCYEIYGKNPQQEKVEIYFNPVDAAVVKEEKK